jgi:hypothetical protein
MESQNCFVEFEISDFEKFDDLQRIFEIIKVAKNEGKPNEDAFWLSVSPKYFTEKFCFLETDIRPNYNTVTKGEFFWFFYGLIELLTIDYEIEYISCYNKGTHKGRLEYNPYSYPYGGISGLVTFVDSFDCRPVKIDDGTGLYEIDFLANGDFSITDTEDIQRQNSSEKRFDATQLLHRFVKRFKK